MAQVVVNADHTSALLVVAGDRVPTLPHVIRALGEFAGLRAFTVVCPPDVVAQARAVVAGSGAGTGTTLRVVDEREVLPGLDPEGVMQHLPANLPGGRNRGIACWYYQQFLKMGFAAYAPDEEYYLIWDGDTLPLRPLQFRHGERILLTTSHEYHRDYFQTLQRLLPGVALPTVSHISQHVLVRSADMRALLAELAAPGQTWWQHVLACLNGRTPQQFSEYETYAAYCLARWPQRYQSIQRRWLRRGSSLFRAGMGQADTRPVADLYDYVAFESWDQGPRNHRKARWRVARDRMADWCERRLGLTWYPR